MSNYTSTFDTRYDASYDTRYDTRSITGRSITANHGSQRYGDSYKVIDAREADRLRSNRLTNFRTDREPFYIRGQSASSSRGSMGQHLNDWDAAFETAGGQ